MKVSFDLDEVLFVSPARFETEPPLRFPFNRLFPDRLRKGTPQLIHDLQDEGFEVWIYTSSLRTETYIRNLFRGYGVRLDAIVNGYRHQEEVQRNRKEALSQKMPNHYRISLHVDDEKSVVENGRRFGYRAIRVCEPDDHWAEKVLEEAKRIRRLEEAEHAKALKRTAAETGEEHG